MAEEEMDDEGLGITARIGLTRYVMILNVPHTKQKKVIVKNPANLVMCF
jgi:hypothetical protein